MATSGRQWAELVAFKNSGTYCNQYMVVDLKLFRPGEELQPDLLWVIEQVPHLVLLTGHAGRIYLSGGTMSSWLKLS